LFILEKEREWWGEEQREMGERIPSRLSTPSVGPVAGLIPGP